MPAEIAQGMTTCTDGTVKGLRCCLVKHHRSGIYTDEALECYNTSFINSRSLRGSHIASKANILQYVNGQRDDQITGTSSVHISDYSIRHYVLGQIPVVLEILALCSFGFPKRFHEVWACHVDTDADQTCDESVTVETKGGWGIVQCIGLTWAIHPGGKHRHVCL